MNKITVLCVFVISCSSSAAPPKNAPAPAAGAQTSTESAADSRSAAAQPPKQQAQPASQPVYSTLTGIQLAPEQMLEAPPPELAELAQNIFKDDKLNCAQLEIKALRSNTDFRLIDAEAEAFLSDARKIGWQFKIRKRWLDAATYDARWHGETRVVALLYTPQRLCIGICQPAPAASAPPRKP